MPRVAFKMKLFKGCEAEYKKRHDALWPELRLLLKESGIRDYSIFLDDENSILFACLYIEDPSRLETLRGQPVMQKWWDHMKDLMETNEDHSPVSQSLQEMFYLP